jgi:YD repeat-containing protein
VDARGIEILYTYDALNRVLTETHPTSSVYDITYTYDTPSAGLAFTTGRLSLVTDRSGTKELGYDARGNVTTERITQAATTRETLYSYNEINLMSSQTYPSGRTLSYQYDLLGRVQDVLASSDGVQPQSSVITDINYKPFGPVTSYTFANSLEHQMQFDTDYRVQSVTLLDGSTPIDNRAYQYSLFDEITAILGDDAETYEYDNLHRLTSADGAYGNLDYSYDEVGNRLTRTIDGDLETYSYTPPGSGNRLQSVTKPQGIRTFQYDAAGNITQDARSDGTTITNTFNDRARLQSVSPTTSGN